MHEIYKIERFYKNNPSFIRVNLRVSVVKNFIK